MIIGIFPWHYRLICFAIVVKNGSGSGGATSSADTGINKGRPQSGKGAGASNTCLKVKVMMKIP